MTRANAARVVKMTDAAGAGVVVASLWPHASSDGKRREA